MLHLAARFFPYRRDVTMSLAAPVVFRLRFGSSVITRNRPDGCRSAGKLTAAFGPRHRPSSRRVLAEPLNSVVELAGSDEVLLREHAHDSIEQPLHVIQVAGSVEPSRANGRDGAACGRRRAGASANLPNR